MFKINRSDVKTLKILLSKSKNGLQTFRYFSKRKLNIINSHLISIIMIENENPIAYGHIEEENGKYWLGILVSDCGSGKGIGKNMMTVLINSAFSFQVKEIHLTVDKINEKAIKLYKKFGFKIINKKKQYLLMRLVVKNNKMRSIKC